MQIVTNLIAFKIGWLASVLGAAKGFWILGPAAILVAIGIHLRNAVEPRRELQLILVSGLVGATCDSVMVASGWLTYPSGTIVAGLSPLWIVGLWMLFATTFNTSMRPLQAHLPLAGVLGAISGPLSYYFGAKIGAVVIGDPATAFTALAVAYGLFVPLLLAVASRLDGMPAKVEASRPSQR